MAALFPPWSDSEFRLVLVSVAAMSNELLRRILFLPRQRSTIARDIDVLHYLLIAVTMAGATIVASFAIYFMIRYRRRTRDLHAGFPGATARPRPAFEVGTMALLVVVFVAFWIIGVRQYVRVRVPPEHANVVYVTARQWLWEFAYPDGASSVATLVVPARRPVKLVMTSPDVIHSFYVPEFRLKYDVVPGRYTTLWFEATEPGAYPILCAEYCGTDHSIMRGEVIALDSRDFARWTTDHDAAGQACAPRRPLSLARMGEHIAAEQGCLRCHTADGTPHIGPTWAGIYMSTVPLEGGGTVIADDTYLTESMLDPRARIRLGFEPVMPTFLGRLQPAEVGAILEYIHSLRYVVPKPGARTPTPEGEEEHR